MNPNVVYLYLGLSSELRFSSLRICTFTYNFCSCAISSCVNVQLQTAQPAQPAWDFGHLCTQLRRGEMEEACVHAAFLCGRFPERLHGTGGQVYEGGCAASSEKKKKRIFVAMCKGSVLVLGSPGTVVLHSPAAISELRQQKGHPCSSQGAGLCLYTL